MKYLLAPIVGLMLGCASMNPAVERLAQKTLQSPDHIVSGPNEQVEYVREFEYQGSTWFTYFVDTNGNKHVDKDDTFKLAELCQQFPIFASIDDHLDGIDSKLGCVKWGGERICDRTSPWLGKVYLLTVENLNEHLARGDYVK